MASKAPRNFLVLLVLIIAATAGAFFLIAERKIGGGGRSVNSASGVSLDAGFGIKSKSHLGFVIFSQFPAAGGVSVSGGSAWEGEVRHPNGTGIDYQSSLSTITINQQEFEFENGRVFFVKALGELKVHQLDLEILEAKFSAEIERISKLDAIDALTR